MTSSLDRRRFAGATIAASVLLIGFGQGASARAPEIYTGIISRTALGGYDPVAYFREGKPRAGSRSLTYDWKGATWRFVSEENRALFRANPETYAPQFGGHCAWAVARNYRAKGDPNYWRILDGKLYLNYDAKVQAEWEKDIPTEIKRADANWPAVLDK
jgi:YHS domain-containing protein